MKSTLIAYYIYYVLLVITLFSLGVGFLGSAVSGNIIFGILTLFLAIPGTLFLGWMTSVLGECNGF